MIAVVFKATITSQTPPASYTVSESGHLVKKVEVSKRFAKPSQTGYRRKDRSWHSG
jgi:hypothetical protein